MSNFSSFVVLRVVMSADEDKGRRDGEGLWRDTGEGAEERRRERAGMPDEAGTMGREPSGG